MLSHPFFHTIFIPCEITHSGSAVLLAGDDIYIFEGWILRKGTGTGFGSSDFYLQSCSIGNHMTSVLLTSLWFHMKQSLD